MIVAINAVVVFWDDGRLRAYEAQSLATGGRPSSRRARSTNGWNQPRAAKRWGVSPLNSLKSAIQWD